jgi:hypothetical protein
LTAGLLLALMIAWSGHEDVLMGLAFVLAGLTLAQTVTSHPQPPQALPIHPSRTGKLKIS